MPGQLFTDYFLSEGIQSTDEWAASLATPREIEAFREGLRRPYEALSRARDPNESVTEQELILPVLELLGWTDYLPHQGTALNEDIPDYLLFPDAALKERAGARPTTASRYRDAVVVEESKRFDLPLDASGRDARPRPVGPSGSRLFELPAEYGAARTVGPSRRPHGQMLRYLSTAEIESDGRIRWGFLTNGRVWRLYDYRARPRATSYFEASIDDVVRPENEHCLRVFYLLFRRNSFVLRQGATTTFLEHAIAEGKRYEEQVAQDLSGVVFNKVFPGLVQALYAASNRELADVRQAALVLLYRLLFILYAEDRGLLPVNERGYRSYGLRRPVRDAIAERMGNGSDFSTTATNYYDHVMTLCRLIDKGDPSIRLPPYNGGLFAGDAAPLLEQVRLPDSAFAPVVHYLSHVETAEGSRFVNYRDMSVQQLGSIYERLLEREPVLDAEGGIDIRPNPYARKDSGSFYTPQDLVDLVIERTLGPLMEERRKAFADRAAELGSDRRPKAVREAELAKADPAEAVLELKVLDPAMGSGHFLVTAVDFLSDHIAELVEYPPEVDWLDGDYVSPLVGRLASIRKGIKRNRGPGRIGDDGAELTDLDIIRRMVLKRCIYGVDKNPMTVELAKVSLWLHSFTVGAPLSFLDHHLRCGDSLVGMRVNDATKELGRLGGMHSGSAIQSAESSAQAMSQIEQMSDADVAEVRESVQLFRNIEATTSEIRGVLDTLCGVRWLAAGMKTKERAIFEEPLVGALALQEDKAYQLIARGASSVDDQDSVKHRPFWPSFKDLWSDAKAVGNQERFLHWEVDFPGVWRRWQDPRPVGGFDAIIGNPPWGLVEQPATEWFPLRGEEVEWPERGAERTALIQRRIEDGDELAIQYDVVRQRSATLRAYARGTGDYPLLSGGRVNLASLFVERVMSLLKPDGMAGLLTPSGIYADKPSIRFFKSISTRGRVGGLFDFENRKIFFKDVHGSLKFCALIFSGEERHFDQTECAFFLHDTKTIMDQDRRLVLTPSDFARVNPNTGTVPVFRTRRDADIIRRIYKRHPVLVDRSGGEETKIWPLRHVRGMFNLTSDFPIFRTAGQLEDEGFYPVVGKRWRMGDELYLAHYQGRMIHQFDHRWNSVGVNPQSAHNPYINVEVTQEQHADPNFCPSPQYWVHARRVEATVPKSHGWSLGFRDVARPTDVRTVIASVIPWVSSDLAIRLILPTGVEFGGGAAGCLLANFNSFAFDFVARQKVQGIHVSWYIVDPHFPYQPCRACRKQ